MEVKLKKSENEIRIDINSKVEEIILKAEHLFKEENFRAVKFNAIGGNIKNLIIVVETLKYILPGLHQQNKISTVGFLPMKKRNKTKIKKLYPKLEIFLTLDNPEKKGEGYQEPLNEEKRKKFLKIYETNKGNKKENKNNSDNQNPIRKYKQRFSQLFGLEENVERKHNTTLRIIKWFIIIIFCIAIALPIFISLFSFFLIFYLHAMTWLNGTSLNDMNIKNKYIKSFFDFTNYAVLICLGIGYLPFGYICLSIMIIISPFYFIYSRCRKKHDDE